MSFNPRVGEALAIDGLGYRFVEHPAVAGTPFGQEGRRGVVYQLIDPYGEYYALKVFRPQYRGAHIAEQAERLRPFAHLPGLQACRRYVLSPDQHGPLIARRPELAFAVLMPWVAGQRWSQLFHHTLERGSGRALARALAGVLAGLEHARLAHGDLAGSSVLIDPACLAVALVDMEDLYGPGIASPDPLPTGSAGYAHPAARAGVWSPRADRFAGAVLLAEMLGWCDERVRTAAAGEQYFAAAELQSECERCRALVAVLRERHSEAVAVAFLRAWRSPTPEDCPRFEEWRALLAELPTMAMTAETVAVTPLVTDGVVEHGRGGVRLATGPPRQGAASEALAAHQAQLLARRASEREAVGDLQGALADYREAAHAAPMGALREEWGNTVAVLDARLALLAPWRCPNADCSAPLPAGTLRCPSCGLPTDEPAPLRRPAGMHRWAPAAAAAALAILVAGLLARQLAAPPSRVQVASAPAATPASAPAPVAAVAGGTPTSAIAAAPSSSATAAAPLWQVLGDTQSGLFSEPFDIALDAQGDVYVAEDGRHRIIKLSPTGQVLATWGKRGSGAGEFNNPKGMAVDQQGNLYVADTGNDRIEEFDAGGRYLGQFGSPGKGPGQFDEPRGLALDDQGDLYVVDTQNQRVQKLSSAGAFLGAWGSFGSGSLTFNFPYGIALDGQGNVYVADRNNNRVQKIAADGRFVAAWGGEGSTAGRFENPVAVAVDAAGNVYVTDWGNNRVQKFSPGGDPLAQWGAGGSGRGQFAAPYGLAVDRQGSIYVADLGNDRVQKLSPTGQAMAAWGAPRDGSGQFRRPSNVAVDRQGNMYVADRDNSRIQKLSPTGTFLAQWGPYYNLEGIALDGAGNMYVSERLDCRIRKLSPQGQTLALWGACGSGPSQFRTPEAVAVDGAGNVYVADRGNNRVVKLAPSGEFVAAWGSQGNGPGQFAEPYGVALDGAGNVYVADRDNNRVVKLSPSGEFLTAWGYEGSGPGQFEAPEAVAVDAQGNLYVASWADSRIEKLSRNGQFLALLGKAGANAGRFDSPEGLAVDAQGNLYVADTLNNRIQKLAAGSEALPCGRSVPGVPGTLVQPRAQASAWRHSDMIGTSTTRRWTTADLTALPDDGTRYEIIDGALHVSTQPSWEHQVIGANIVAALHLWNTPMGAGIVAIGPGIIFSEDNNVAPDVVWVRAERLPDVLGADRKLHGAPDLAVEILSPGAEHARRDRESKLGLYARRGVQEYWIVDWDQRTLEVYRREGAALARTTTLGPDDTLTSLLLPGFTIPVAQLFAGLPV